MNPLKSHKQIESIIFDLGKVILNIDWRITFEEFKKLDGEGVETIYEALFYDETLLSRIQRGEYTHDELIQLLQNQLKSAITKEEIEKAWNAMLQGFPKERIELIARLSKQYRTFLLSNTNIIHWKHYRRELSDLLHYLQIDKLFEKEYYSHELGMRKPEPRIYEKIIEDSYVTPEKTLFLDDNQDNLNAAAAYGIKTQLVTEEQDIVTLLAS